MKELSPKDYQLDNSAFNKFVILTFSNKGLKNLPDILLTNNEYMYELIYRLYFGFGNAAGNDISTIEFNDAVSDSKIYSFYELRYFMIPVFYTYLFEKDNDLKDKLASIFMDSKNLSDFNSLHRLFVDKPDYNFGSKDAFFDFADQFDDEFTKIAKKQFKIPANTTSFDDDELDIYGQFFDFDFSPNSLDALSLEQYKKYKSKFNLPIIFYKNNVDFSSLNKEEYFANARLSDLLLVFKNKNFTQKEFKQINSVFPFDQKTISEQFNIPIEGIPFVGSKNKAFEEMCKRDNLNMQIVSEFQNLLSLSIDEIIELITSNMRVFENFRDKLKNDFKKFVILNKILN